MRALFFLLCFLFSGYAGAQTTHTGVPKPLMKWNDTLWAEHLRSFPSAVKGEHERCGDYLFTFLPDADELQPNLMVGFATERSAGSLGDVILRRRSDVHVMASRKKMTNVVLESITMSLKEKNVEYFIFLSRAESKKVLACIKARSKGKPPTPRITA